MNPSFKLLNHVLHIYPGKECVHVENIPADYRNCKDIVVEEGILKIKLDVPHVHSLTLPRSLRTVSISQCTRVDKLLASSLTAGVCLLINKDTDYQFYESSTSTVQGDTLTVESAGSFVVPAQTGTARVVVIRGCFREIAPSAFQDMANLERVLIEAPITHIHKTAFSELRSLSYVQLPESLTRIGPSAFSHCTNLREIQLPNSLSVLDQYAFAFCDSLRSISIPDSVVAISAGVFQGCKSLTSSRLSNQVSRISTYMFYGCTNLRYIENADMTEVIGSHAFAGCTSLSEIPPMLKLKTIGNAAFENCRGLVNVSLPFGLTKVDSNAFNSCVNLRYLDVPPTVSQLSSDAFNGCVNLLSAQPSMESSLFNRIKQLPNNHVVDYILSNKITDPIILQYLLSSISAEVPEVTGIMEELRRW